MGGNAHTRPGLSKEKHDANGPTPCWYDRLRVRPFRSVKPRLISNSKPRDMCVPLLRLAKLQTLIASWGQGWGAVVAWRMGVSGLMDKPLVFKPQACGFKYRVVPRSLR